LSFEDLRCRKRRTIWVYSRTRYFYYGWHGSQ